MVTVPDSVEVPPVIVPGADLEFDDESLIGDERLLVEPDFGQRISGKISKGITDASGVHRDIVLCPADCSGLSVVREKVFPGCRWLHAAMRMAVICPVPAKPATTSETVVVTVGRSDWQSGERNGLDGAELR
jgi:hypothetical protein